jgi:hypothetical protein
MELDRPCIHFDKVVLTFKVTFFNAYNSGEF